MTLFHYRNGIDLGEALDALQQRLGYHLAITKDAYFEGMEGNATMRALMDGLHTNPVREFLGIPVAAVGDYLSDVMTYADGHTEEIVGLPASDVVKFFLEDGSTICVRPSGTEPKVKFYIEVVAKEKAGLTDKADALFADLAKKLGIKL